MSKGSRRAQSLIWGLGLSLGGNLSPLLVGSAARAQDPPAAPAATPSPAGAEPAPAPPAPAPPPAPALPAHEPGTVPVTVRADKPVSIRPRPFSSSTEEMWASPSVRTLWLRPGERYAVTGPGISEHQFKFPARMGQQIDIRTGSARTATTGKVLLGLGCPVAGIGLLVAATTGVFYGLGKAVCDDGSEICSEPPKVTQDNSYGKAFLFGGVAGGIGLPVCLSGAILLGRGQTEVDIGPGVLRASYARAGGLWLTPRGLAF